MTESIFTKNLSDSDTNNASFNFFAVCLRILIVMASDQQI
jgi:hypothetical protein